MTDKEQHEYNEGLNRFADEFRAKHEADNAAEIAKLKDEWGEDFEKNWNEEFWLRHRDEIEQLWNEEWQERQNS